MRDLTRITLGLSAVLLFACGANTQDPPASANDEDAAAKVATDVQATDAATAEAGEPEAKAPEGAVVDNSPRIGALGPHTWIWKKTERTGLAIGKMRIGTSVKLKSKDPLDGPGCRGKWYSIEPRGFVCDDDTATLDLEDPYYRVLAASAPKDGTWPYRYAHSNGAPMYSRVPTPEEWAKAEREYGAVNTWFSLGAWAKGHEENILDEPIKATDERPSFIDENGKRTGPAGNYNTQVLVLKRMPAGSMLAYSRAFEMHGRVWLVTPDAMIMPADRVSDMKDSEFEAVHFGEGSKEKLPFAWNRAKEPITLYKKDGDVRFVQTSATLASKTHVEIVDEEVRKDGFVYYELRNDPGTFIGKNEAPEKLLDSDVTITRLATKIPSGIKDGEKWIQVRVVPGTLTAYQGLTPIMTTMFSPGKGGVPMPNYKFPEDHSKFATTALGYFPIEWKERVATMSNEKGEPKVLWFTDVPHQQYLKAPLAMHVTYWHDDFGKRKSAECVNVSPKDGAWLFGWTDPPLPEGWNAIGAGQGNGKSTPIHVSAN